MKEDAPTASLVNGESDDSSGGDNKSKKESESEVPIRTRDIGIWRMFYQDSPWGFLPGFDTIRKLKEVISALPFVWRFLGELWLLAPGYLILEILLSIWGSLDGAISLWTTTQMLQTVSAFLVGKRGKAVSDG